MPLVASAIIAGFRRLYDEGNHISNVNPDFPQGFCCNVCFVIAYVRPIRLTLPSSLLHLLGSIYILYEQT